MTLHLVCDISGSMGDSGKLFSMRTVVMAVTQWARLGHVCADIKLYGWAAEVRHFADWDTRDEYPAELLSCGGTLNGEVLIKWLGETPDAKVLLFTDGYWTQAGARVLQQWRERLPQDTLRVIKIGADANPHLKGRDVFAPEDLFVALDDWPESGVA